MTPKQQAIKKAYGEHYDTFKGDMDENGWVLRDPGHKNHIKWGENRDVYEWDATDSGLWRPSSLRGIENNRGWISVKDRLPKGADHGKDFWLYDKDQDFYPATWDNYSRAWETEKSFISPHEVTHWQPVVKPEPPLY